MKKIKSTPQHTIYEKRSGRYAIKDRRKRWVQGDDKVAILKAEGLVKAQAPKAAAPEPEPDAEADAGEAGTGESAA